VDALPELQPVDLDDDRAIWPDVDEGIRRVDLRLGRRLACFLRRHRTIEIQRNEQTACGSGGDAQKRPPAQEQIVRSGACG
jgi:hypothetical protein